MRMERWGVSYERHGREGSHIRTASDLKRAALRGSNRSNKEKKWTVEKGKSQGHRA